MFDKLEVAMALLGVWKAKCYKVVQIMVEVFDIVRILQNPAEGFCQAIKNVWGRSEAKW